jgi:hypothetical protein
MRLRTTASAALTVLVLAGCASPASQVGMTTSEPPVSSSLNIPNELKGQLAVRDVIGGKETNPLWLSSISSADFQSALEASLRNFGLGPTAPQTGRYQVAAALKSVDQPLIGLNLTVIATVHYDLIERSTNKSAWATTITRSHTAQFSESLFAVQRLRFANEGAARANIEAFIEELLKSGIGK